MFHHYSENSASTGEPPTPPSTATSNLLPAPGVEGSSQRQPMGSSRSLNGQEPDSGYEASPSSIADNNSCTLHFFGEQSMEAGASASAESSLVQLLPSEEEGDDAHDSVFLILDSDIDEWDMCPECNSYADCDCYRNDSENTTASDATATIAGCDNSSHSSDLSSSNRPSSSPVRIPSRTTVSRTLPWRSTSPLVDLRLQTSRSVDCPRRGSSPSLQAFGLVSGSHPLSWPPTAAPWLSPNQFASALPVYLSPNLNSAAWVRTRTNHRPVRSRRRLIDSDASSLSSSEEEGPEDVFSMAAESAPPFEMLNHRTGPLPDLVLESTSSTEGRRSRSLSVNLPLDQGDINLDRIQAIGRTLRRLSDQFEQRREIRYHTARRMTIGDVIHFRRAP